MGLMAHLQKSQSSSKFKDRLSWRVIYVKTNSHIKWLFQVPGFEPGSSAPAKGVPSFRVVGRKPQRRNPTFRCAQTSAQPSGADPQNPVKRDKFVYCIWFIWPHVMSWDCQRTIFFKVLHKMSSDLARTNLYKQNAIEDQWVPQCRRSSALLQLKGKRPSKIFQGSKWSKVTGSISDIFWLNVSGKYEMTFWLWFSTACDVFRETKCEMWHCSFCDAIIPYINLYHCRWSMMPNLLPLSALPVLCPHQPASWKRSKTLQCTKGRVQELLKNNLQVAASFSIDIRFEALTQMRLSLTWPKQLLTRCFCANAVQHFPDLPPAVLLSYDQTSRLGDLWMGAKQPTVIELTSCFAEHNNDTSWCHSLFKRQHWHSPL